MSVDKELEVVRKTNGGELLPEDVVAFAKTKSTKLHDCFEWDDKKAGHLHRVERARQLIRFVVIAQPKQELKRAYIHTVTQKKSVYLPTAKVLNDKHLRAQEVATGIVELKQWLEKYKDMKEFKKIASALSKLI